MRITAVRIKLMLSDSEPLQGFGSIVFDNCFVVRDLKIIQGTKGLLVSMPSRKLHDHCPSCHRKNELTALFCNGCGSQLATDRAPRDSTGRAKLYADIAHPINMQFREIIDEHVLRAFNEEIELSLKPGYVCLYDQYDANTIAYYDRQDDHSASHRNTILFSDYYDIVRPSSERRLRQPSQEEAAFGAGIPGLETA